MLLTLSFRNIQDRKTDELRFDTECELHLVEVDRRCFGCRVHIFRNKHSSECAQGEGREGPLELRPPAPFRVFVFLADSVQQAAKMDERLDSNRPGIFPNWRAFYRHPAYGQREHWSRSGAAT